MIRYAEKVFEYFDFSSGIGSITGNSRKQQLYISGKMKLSTFLFFMFGSIIFTLLKIASRIRFLYWFWYAFNNYYNVNYNEATNL